MTGKMCVLEREKPAAYGTPGKRSATGSPPPVAAKPDWKVLSIMIDPLSRTDVRPNKGRRFTLTTEQFATVTIPADTPPGEERAAALRVLDASGGDEWTVVFGDWYEGEYAWTGSWRP